MCAYLLLVIKAMQHKKLTLATGNLLLSHQLILNKRKQ